MQARRFVGICSLLLALLAATPAAALEVAEATVATSVDDRRPVGVGQQFPASVGSLYCFSRLTGAAGETAVAHVWYYGEREMARITLPVRSSNWRTWSSKRLLPQWQGEWRVDIVDASGEVLQAVPFVLEAE